MVHGTREVFQYALCGGCGSLALVNPPKDLTPYYKDYYSTSAPAQNALNAPSLLSRLFLNRFRAWAMRYSILGSGPLARFIYFRKTVDSLAWGPLFNELQKARVPLSLGTRFLDVGSGGGRALHLLAAAGFTHLTGCDPFIDRDIALEPSGVIHKGALESVNGLFDVIMFHHCFEHVPDPPETLITAASLLAPEGIIVIRFPNIDSVEFEKFKGNWWGIHAPRHFFLPSQTGMQLMAQNAGLEIQFAYCDSTFDHYLYSTEYEMDIHDRHPKSFRADSAGLWTTADLNAARQKAARYNREMRGDWIAYVLRHPKHD